MSRSVYAIYHFPGFNPRPTRCRWLWLARWLGRLQRGANLSELRIICEAGPNKGEHYVI